MGKYKILIIIYLISVVSSVIANFLGLDVQDLYRVPFINIRWIDIAILIVVGSYFYSLTRKNYLNREGSFIILLCYIYLLFEAFQLAKTWQATDTGWQISGFLCTLSFFILIDLSTFKISESQILIFMKYLSLSGSLVLIITNGYLVYSFISGNVIFTDLDIRASLDVIGAKESVTTDGLNAFVYAFSLYFIRNEMKLWKKLIYVAAIVSIYAALVIKLDRGGLITIITITILYILMFSRKPYQVINKIFVISLVFIIFYYLFGNILREKGYDPIEKLTQTIQFSMDINNPDWEKGRSIPIEYAISAWRKNVFIGVGYIDLYHYGLPEGMGAAHNFIIASLFQRGIIGTGIYLLILIILYGNSIKFWGILAKTKSYQNDMFKILIVVSFFWFIPFMTQDVIWEKYSLSLQFVFLGIITNIYKQRKYSATTSNSLTSFQLINKNLNSK